MNIRSNFPKMNNLQTNRLLITAIKLKEWPHKQKLLDTINLPLKDIFIVKKKNVIKTFYLTIARFIAVSGRKHKIFLLETALKGYQMTPVM